MELFVIVAAFVVAFLILNGWMSGRSRDKDYRIIISISELALAYGLNAIGETTLATFWAVLGILNLLIGLFIANPSPNSQEQKDKS